MPVINSEDFVIDLFKQGLNTADEPIEVVNGNGTDKWKIQLKTTKWDGSAYDALVQVNVYFNDGRAALDEVISISSGVYFEITSDEPRVLELTIVDKTPGSNYFTKKIVQFS